MSLFNPQQEKSLSAFLSALSHQDESLPEGLQKQLYSIGQNLDNRVVELPTVAASLPNLDKAYRAALADERADDESSATLVSTDQKQSDQLRDHAVKILTDPDPVRAAQRKIPRGLGQIVSNPFKRLFGQG
ncbi:MAG: hypothetical protein WA865_16230 [Spirulinaceae cyanobacterium]